MKSGESKKLLLILISLMIISLSSISFVSAWNPSTTISSDGVSHTIELVNVDNNNRATMSIDGGDVRTFSPVQSSSPYFVSSVKDLKFILTRAYSNNREYGATLLIGVEKNLSSIGNTITTFNFDGISHTIELMNVDSDRNHVTIMIDGNYSKTISPVQSSSPYFINPLTSDLKFVLTRAYTSNTKYESTLLILYEKNFSSVTGESCIDSDNGKNYYIKGSVSGLSDGGLSYNYDDSCSQDIVAEWYCDGTKPKADTTYVCLKGCSNGACLNNSCIPQCSGKECGDDGCGESCGTCDSGKLCNASGNCISSSNNYCLDSNNYSTNVVVEGKNYTIEISDVSSSVILIVTNSSGDSRSGNIGVGSSKTINSLTIKIISASSNSRGFNACFEIINSSNSCILQCSGKECGDDGCGESCGTCDSGKSCQDGNCVSQSNNNSHCLNSNNYSANVVVNRKNYTIEIDGVLRDSVSLIITNSSGDSRSGNIGVGSSKTINSLTIKIISASSNSRGFNACFEIVSASENQNVVKEAGFFEKILNFFKGLFGIK